MIDVLMIALQFAPVQTTGAFRSIEFAKRLVNHGIRLTVLTIDPEQAKAIFGAEINPSLSDCLPESVQVQYLQQARPVTPETPLAQLWRMLTKLDDTFESRFTPSLMARLAELKRGPRRFAAVYVSAPPFGATMLGKRASDELQLPYLIDMRDAWAQWSPGRQISWLHYMRKQRDEARAFSAADAVVAVTPELTDLFATSHPEIPRHRFHTITNGIGGIADLPHEAIWAGTAKTINIGYVGSFYWTPSNNPSFSAPHRYLQYDPGLEDWSYRSPLFFFRAWAELDKQAPKIGGRLRFHHVGREPDWLMPMAAKYGLADRCVCHGAIPKQDVQGFLENMTGLLGTSMKRIHGLDYCLATKSFEYLASGKATLAFVCSGAQKRFFQEVGGAVIFEPDDPKGSAKLLQSLIGKDRRLEIKKDALNHYDHNRTSAQMASLIRQVAASKVLHAT